MPQLDFSTFSPQLIWLVITFLGLYLLMSRVALPRIGGVIEQRQSRQGNCGV
jgi:F-type H+-transporting ATPase subunit b